MMTPLPCDVFISYAWKDGKDAVARLKEGLARRGLCVWRDDPRLFLGDELSDELGRGLNGSSLAVAIASPEYAERRWTLLDLEGMVCGQFKGRIIPILYRTSRDYVAGMLPPVIAPDFSPDGDGRPPTIVGDKRYFWVTISTSEGSLEGYRLAESDPDSCVFEGTVLVTGFAAMRGQKKAAGGTVCGATHGSGPHDGMLACGPDDAIRVSIKSAFAGPVHRTAPVIWRIEDVQIPKASYLPGEEIGVRVTGMDMSVSHGRPDEFCMRAWSDSDREGIQATACETGNDSGVFEGRFRTGDGRSHPEQSILEASGGDAVYAEYVDETLPGPYSYHDSVEIASMATITTKKKAQASLARLVVANVLIWNKKTSRDALVAGDETEVLVRVSNPEQEISFAAVFQVTDLGGAIVKALYQQLRAKAEGHASPIFSWTPTKPGIYSIHVALLKSIDDTTAYAHSVFKPVQVVDPRDVGAGQGGDQGGAGHSASARDGGAPGPTALGEERCNAGRARRVPERRRSGR